jgi:threonine aldolase
MIDLRSDTVSRPTPAMREAIATAEVGDDVYGDDPTVKSLEAETARLLGKQDAVYMPTGTMTNQVAIRTHTEPGNAVLVEQSAHVYLLEGGAISAFSGALPRVLPGTHGIFTAAEVTRALDRSHPFFPATVAPPVTLLCVENTHNNGGGAVWPLDELLAVTEAGRRHGLALHLDGARLWHAALATGVPEAEIAAPFDTVSVCFSKALGAPVGSCLAGSVEQIARARRFKQQMGGGFRQAGLIAAGALHALAHHRPRLGETHVLARQLAEGLARIPGVLIDPAAVPTNIVRFRLEGVDNGAFVDELFARGVHVLPSGPDGVRAVLYLDISPADVDLALAAIGDTMKHLVQHGE